MVEGKPVETTGEAPLLVGEDLKQMYAGRTIVEVERVEIRSGEVLALLGPNGAGKSTLMRILAGLEKPMTGRRLFRGRPIESDDREFRRAAVAMLQRPYLWRGSVRQNVDYGLKVRKVAAEERRRRTREVLTQLGIEDLEEAPVDSLSGGELKRAALARALAPRPELLFLDEPTADLDVSVRKRLLADLERVVHREASAVVLITHDPGEAFSLADRVAVFEEGTVVQAGSPAEIFERPATEFVASFTGAEFLLKGKIADSGEGTVFVRLDSGHLVEAQGSGPKGSRVRVAYRPEDVVIATAVSTSESSARNRFLARIERLGRSGGLIRLGLDADGLGLEAMITAQALRELGLDVGSPVVAQIKATALHTFTA